ncbi:hypothetical protein KAR48_00090 [bacterium]|nr:hypothetical protein [bacterium]
MKDALPPQEQIESSMAAFCDEARWEAIHLFSSEGLPLASHGESTIYDESSLLEYLFSMMGTHALLEGEPIQEIMIRGSQGRRIVFRYVTAWEDPAVLIAVVYARKGFRRAMGKLIKLIQSFS